MQMKRSRYVSLMIVSTLTLSACESEMAGTRNEYPTINECVEDWGDDDECEQGPRSWLGPIMVFDAHDRRYYYKSKKHGGKLISSDLNAKFKSIVAGQTISKASSKIPTAVKIGGFGKSAGFFGASG